MDTSFETLIASLHQLTRTRGNEYTHQAMSSARVIASLHQYSSVGSVLLLIAALEVRDSKIALFNTINDLDSEQLKSLLNDATCPAAIVRSEWIPLDKEANRAVTYGVELAEFDGRTKASDLDLLLSLLHLAVTEPANMPDLVDFLEGIEKDASTLRTSLYEIVSNSESSDDDLL